jgi:hypothetical protein
VAGGAVGHVGFVTHRRTANPLIVVDNSSYP